MPNSVYPVFSGMPQVVYAKDQPQYRPLPSITYPEMPNGPVTSRWRLTEEERQEIANGGDLYLTLLTFHRPLQPILLQVFETEYQAETTLRLQGMIPAREKAESDSAQSS